MQDPRRRFPRGALPVPGCLEALETWLFPVALETCLWIPAVCNPAHHRALQKLVGFLELAESIEYLDKTMLLCGELF